MNKLQAFFQLTGKTKEENFQIQKEKYMFLFNRCIRIFLKNIPILSMGKNLKKSSIVDTGCGLFYIRKKTSDLHFISGSYEFKVRKLIEKFARESEVIIDIGAHIGKYSILASKINPNARIYAIEPERDNFNLLNKNIGLNKIKNVFPIKVALSDKKGVARLYKNKTSTGGSSLKTGGNLRIKWDDFEEVKTDTLNNLFSKLNHIDLIKMDTEASEFNILKGAKKLLSEKKIKNIIIEIGVNNMKNVKNLFESYGYKLKRVQHNNYLATY